MHLFHCAITYKQETMLYEGYTFGLDFVPTKPSAAVAIRSPRAFISISI